MYSACKKNKNKRKRIRANHQHIWGNYKSLAMMAKSLQHAETTKLPVQCCCIALNSSLHYNMWMLVFQKAWQRVWVAVPALHFDPDELEKTQHYKNTSQYGKLEEKQKRYKSSKLWTSADGVRNPADFKKFLTKQNARWRFWDLMKVHGWVRSEILLGAFV